MNNIRNIMNLASLTGMLAVGIGVLLIGGNVDLSAGAVAMFSGVLLAIMMRAGVPWLLALVGAIVFGGAAGALNALLSIKLGIMPFITTLAMSSFWQGLGGFITNNQSIPVADETFWLLGSYRLFGLFPLPFIIFIVMVAIYGYILKYTNIGRKLYMCGGNSTAARLAGINVQRTSALLMVNCSAIAAFTGCMYAARLKTINCTSILGTDLDAITACCLGGIAFAGGDGGMAGSLIGVLLLICFKNGLQIIGFSNSWQVVASGVLLIVALAVDFVATSSRRRALERSAHELMK